MNGERKITKTEFLLLGLTALFLCSLLMLHAHDRSAMAGTGVEVDADVPQDIFLPDVTPLDLNAATAEELTELPGIGEELSRRILEYREENGGFRSVEELMEVSGIGEGKFAALEGRVTVNGGASE